MEREGYKMMKFFQCLPWFRGWTCGEIKEFFVAFLIVLLFMAAMFILMCTVGGR